VRARRTARQTDQDTRGEFGRPDSVCLHTARAGAIAVSFGLSSPAVGWLQELVGRRVTVAITYRRRVDREPQLDRDGILRGVQDLFGIHADGISFVPVGYATACYELTHGSVATWFLKIFPDTGVTASVIERQPAVLRLLLELSRSMRTARVLAPVATRHGGLIGTIENLPAVLFPYVSGSAPAGGDPAVWAQSAIFLAELHSTPSPADHALPRDAFDDGLIDVGRRALRDVESLAADDLPHAWALREIVLPRTEDLTVQLERLHTLGTTLRSRRNPDVVCHTDFGGDNLLISPDGEMTVVDWDGATIAPPEYDLWIASQTDAVTFLHAYRTAGGETELDARRFEFYLLRRYLEDMTARLTNLLYEGVGSDEAGEALDGMARWGWNQWDNLDSRVARIEAALVT